MLRDPGMSWEQSVCGLLDVQEQDYIRAHIKPSDDGAYVKAVVYVKKEWPG